jgi:hypothetical protein
MYFIPIKNQIVSILLVHIIINAIKTRNTILLWWGGYPHFIGCANLKKKKEFLVFFFQNDETKRTQQFKSRKCDFLKVPKASK